MMRREDIIEYANRDWKGAERAKERFWAERKKLMTPAEVFALMNSLRATALARCPDWPNEEELRADLETHARVSEMLQRASRRRDR